MQPHLASRRLPSSSLLAAETKTASEPLTNQTSIPNCNVTSQQPRAFVLLQVTRTYIVSPTICAADHKPCACSDRPYALLMSCIKTRLFRDSPHMICSILTIHRHYLFVPVWQSCNHGWLGRHSPGARVSVQRMVGGVLIERGGRRRDGESLSRSLLWRLRDV